MTPQMVVQLQRTMGNRAVVQMMSKHRAQADSEAPEVQKTPNRTGLPDHVKAGVEDRSGLSMDDVQVHYNSSQPAAYGALAYTQGTDIHVGPGQENYVAHEAWHVVQQKQGRVAPQYQINQTSVNEDPALEDEADRIGGQIQLARTSRAATPPAKSSGIQPTRVLQGKWGGVNLDPLNEKMMRTNPLTKLIQLSGGKDNIPPAIKHVILTGLSGPLFERIKLRLIAAYEDDGALYTLNDLWALVANEMQSAIPTDVESESRESEDAEPDPIAPMYLVKSEMLGDNFDLTGLESPEARFNIFVGLMVELGRISESQGWELVKNRTNYPAWQDAFKRWWTGGVFTRSQFSDLVKDLPIPDQGTQTEPVQFARGPGPSYQKKYTSTHYGDFEDVTYMRDAKGNINFASPEHGWTKWTNPVKAGDKRNLEDKATGKGWGVLKSGLAVMIAKAGRSQHFSIANRILKRPGSGQPEAGYTWHHLVSHYEMVPVDQKVHSKHGHNGGFYFWT